MLRKPWQPRRPPASFPPMPSPATPDRRAASYFGRLQEWRTRGRTFRSHRSGSTRVSSSRSTSAAAVAEWMTNGPSSLSPRGYARAHLYDHVLATVAGMRARHLSRSIERITWFLAKCMLGRCNQRKAGDDAFARRGTVGLGAGGGRCGAVSGRRCRAQRLSDGGARRLRVCLHEDQRGDAASVGEVLLLHRRDRIDPALRSLCRGRSDPEPFTGARTVRSHVPIA